MVKVKICGITNLGDAQAAVDLGADALGFNFYKKSPRYIEPSQAKPIIERIAPLISIVGIFVDEFSPDRILSIARGIGIDSVQLHGSESPEYVRKLSDLRVIKAFRVDTKFDVRQLEMYTAGAYLLDTYDSHQAGGTGRTFHWDIAVAAKPYGRLILAGGISSENVYESVCQVRPYAIDVCSSVESEPGRKDVKKMSKLFREIWRAQIELARTATE